MIHELAHVIMFTFSHNPTPTRFHGHTIVNRNPPGIGRFNEIVPRDSIETVMVGGNISLAIPNDRDIIGIEPEAVVVVVRESGERCKVIGCKCIIISSLMIVLTWILGLL